jgi:aspartyl-tRNA(Asn)/glutamyl-tRNA(Gln) amidotransferase subunit A
MKPTYDLINKNDIFPLTPSFDHIGWITKNVLDSYIVLQCLSKKNIFKRKTVNKNKYKKSYFKIPGLYNFGKSKITLGIPNTYFFDYLSADIEYLFSNFIKNLLSLNNINLKYFNLKKTEQYYKSWKDIRLAEASNIHQSLFDIRTIGYSNEIKHMLVEGTKVSAIDYIKAIHTINEIKDEFVFLLDHKVDAIVIPTTIISAPKLDAYSVSDINGVSINVREALLRNAIIFNSIGLPAVSIPLGFTKKDKLPVGLQIVGPLHGDETLLSIAYYFECMNNNSLDFIPPISIK